MTIDTKFVTKKMEVEGRRMFDTKFNMLKFNQQFYHHCHFHNSSQLKINFWTERYANYSSNSQKDILQMLDQK